MGCINSAICSAAVSGSPSSVTNLKFRQNWGLDPTGNWKEFNEDSDGNGTYDLEQTRDANAANEITDITNSAVSGSF